LEQKKNKFLAALYEKNFQTAEQTYIDIVKHAENQSGLSENTLKILSQIQTIFKCFKPSVIKHCRPDIMEYNLGLKKIISDINRHACSNIHYIEFLTWETNLGLDVRQKNLLYKTAMNFQLTSGCSNYCRRCNEWALPGARSHFSYKAIVKILKHLADQGNDEISLYSASDPLDWEQDEKTISDIIDYLDTLPLEYSLLTKVPKGKESLLKTLLKNHSNLSVSITSKNKARIKKIEQDFGNPISTQHDMDELLIPAGLDEDFVTIKPSITDGYGVEINLDGAFIIIPTFTSALYPFGHKKIHVDQDTTFFPIKKTGRQALLVDYFKPLKGYGLDQTLGYLPYLLDVQIESITLDNGSEELTPPGMRSIKEYFSIFEETPRIQRKKMTSSIMRRFKKQFLSNTSFKNLSQKNRTLYLKKISSHLNLCKKENCLSSKLYAVSFFLESIYAYAQKNPVKLKIMRFLLKDEIEHAFKPIADRSLEALLSDPDIDSFDIFRWCVFCLLNRSYDSAILGFIRTYPSAYDPDADIFVQYSCYD